MAMDGDIDSSGYNREELQEALARIEKNRFPINYEHLVAEIKKRYLASHPSLSERVKAAEASSHGDVK